MKLSIVIPAFNEELRLPQTLKAYAEFFVEKLGNEVELIVVVNHCSDNTEQVARIVAQEYSQISVVVESAWIG